jgi:nitronate monooxygenase
MGIGISLAHLSSAVANEGGIGTISAAMPGMEEPDLFQDYLGANRRAFTRNIREAKRLAPQGIIGANIMVVMEIFGEMVTTALEEKVDLIFAGSGLPLALPKFKQPHHKTKLVPIVSSGRAAEIICRYWRHHFNYLPDAFVIEGPLAGGHLGFKFEDLKHPEKFSLEQLLAEVQLSIAPFEKMSGRKIPLIVAGGIYTGADIRRFLELGADGVQMATRFVCTTECDASQAFKEAYLKAKKEDIIIIKSPVGLPGRAIKNKFLEQVAAGKKIPFQCPFKCIRTCKVEKSPYCIALALINAKKGLMEHGFAFCGANAWRVNKIMPVKELIKELVDEYEQASHS